MIAVSESLKGRHFTRVADWSRDELESVLDLADELKRLQARSEEHHLLPGLTLGMIFQKPSTRTRVSFEVGIAQLGGVGLYLSAGDLQLGRGETIRERFGRVEAVRVVYLGDGNNVCASLMVACAKLGAEFVAATPPGYRPDERVVEIAREAGRSVQLVEDAREAARGADVLYTDVWTSMGQDEERERRLRDLADFGIDGELVRLAGEDAIVLHCLPAHYGEEITEDVLYGPQSAVWDQSENKMHSVKALMALVMR